MNARKLVKMKLQELANTGRGMALIGEIEMECVGSRIAWKGGCKEPDKKEEFPVLRTAIVLPMTLLLVEVNGTAKETEQDLRNMCLLHLHVSKNAK
jgi:hypothetical protein